MSHTTRALSASSIGHLTIHIVDPKHYVPGFVRTHPVLTSTQELNDRKEAQYRQLDTFGGQPSIIRV